MVFSDKQVTELRRDLDEGYVHSREVQGRTLSYIEGWHAIAEANRIFGFDGWDRETVESKCVLGRENRGTFQAVYVAKVRVTVRAKGHTVVREGYGTGEADGVSTGTAHEKALKTAETDGTKRALATFGKPFGLALYTSARNGRDRGVSNPLPGAPPIPDRDRRRTQQRIGRNGRYFVPSRAPVVLDPALAGVRQPGSAQPKANGAVALQPNPEMKAEAEADADAVKNGAPAAYELTGSGKPKPGRARDGVDAAASDLPVPTAPVQAQTPLKTTPAPEEHLTNPPASAIGETGSPPLQPPAPFNSIEAQAASGLLIDWSKRRREPQHLEYVRTQPCLLCGRTPSDAHHLRFAQPRAMGRKVSDEFTVPLCRIHHRDLHRSGNEVKWWIAADHDVDPIEVAKGLWEESRRKHAGDGGQPAEAFGASAPVK